LEIREETEQEKLEREKQEEDQKKQKKFEEDILDVKNFLQKRFEQEAILSNLSPRTSQSYWWQAPKLLEWNSHH